MFKVSPRLPSALLASALLLSAAALAHAQEPALKTQSPDTAAAFNGRINLEGSDDDDADKTDKAEGRTTQQQGAQSRDSQQRTSRPAPLTAGEKIRRSFRSAFLSPAPYAIAAFNAGITQMSEDRLPHKETDDELADWGSRTARVFATGTTYRLFANGFYPALFKQDPRYEPSRSKKFGRRVTHAVSRLFVTRDDEGNLEPNYSRFAGALTSSALANVWEHSTPGRDRIGADATLRRFGMSYVSGAIGNIIFREFGPDLFSIFKR